MAGLGLAASVGCGREDLQAASADTYETMARKAAFAIPGDVRPAFRDIAAESGLRFRWRIEGPRPLNILQSVGYGCAFLDYDSDGNLDILLVARGPALLRGDGRGAFTDVTAASGLSALRGHFLGCAVGDADNDGDPDVYLSGFGEGRYLRNDGGRFSDATAEAGIGPHSWGSSAGFSELRPGSGRLDLYVAGYVRFGPEVEPQLCEENGQTTGCGPVRYEGIRGTLWQNEGGGRFTDATSQSGASSATGKGLGVAFASVRDGEAPSIAIANDEVPGDLLRKPQGSDRFANEGQRSGTAFDRDGHVHGGMGADFGDYNEDGRLDLLVTTFFNEPRSLYRNEGNGTFSDLGWRTGLAAEFTRFVGFGCKFLDYNNDGRLDIAMANGHVYDNIARIRPMLTYRQSSALLYNTGGPSATFLDVTGACPDLLKPIVGRGLATGDFDNDGRIDLLICDAEGEPLLLRNETKLTGNWIGFRMRGTKSNRDGYGAVLTLEAGGRKLVRQCQSAGSYLSASDPRVHFGLGDAAKVDRLTIRWPSGIVDVIRGPRPGRYHEVVEGATRMKGAESH